MRQRELRRMQELPPEPGLRDAEDAVARHGEVDRGEVHADWCVRPVSRRTRSSALRPSSRSTSKCVTAARGVSVSSDCFVGSLRSRPIGASIVPRHERGWPRTSAR